MAFGANEAAIAEALAGQAVQKFGIWPENEAPMTVLIAMRKQLRRFGQFGQVGGLDYSVLPWVMQQVCIPAEQTASVFKRLQWAEDELVEALNES